MKPDSKEFTKSGVSITLNEDFAEESIEGFDVTYSSNSMAVFMQESEFDGDEEFAAMTVDEYCDAVIKANGKNSEILHKDGLTYYEFSYISDQSINYRYVCFVYKTEDSFWFVQFAVEETNYTLYEDDIFTYAKSVKFNNSSI